MSFLAFFHMPLKCNSVIFYLSGLPYVCIQPATVNELLSEFFGRFAIYSTLQHVPCHKRSLKRNEPDTVVKVTSVLWKEPEANYT